MDQVESTSFLIKWGIPQQNETNGNIRYFTLQAIEIETANIVTFNVSGIQKELTGLHPFYTYELRVATVTIAAGPYSEPFRVQTKEAGKNVLQRWILAVYIE